MNERPVRRAGCRHRRRRREGRRRAHRGAILVAASRRVRATAPSRGASAQRAVHGVAHDISFSLDARRSASCARGVVPIRPSAMAAQARSSGSSRWPKSRLAVQHAVEQRRRRSSPHSAPYASNSAIFSVRSASRSQLCPSPIASSFASAGRYALRRQWPATAATRTSRSRVLDPRSSDCSAPGEPISPSAWTAASAQRHVGLRESLRQRARRPPALQRAGAARPPRAPRPAVGRSDQLHELRGVLRREPRRGRLEQRAQLARSALREPLEHRRQRRSAQLLEQLAAGPSLVGSVSASSSDCSSCASASGSLSRIGICASARAAPA